MIYKAAFIEDLGSLNMGDQLAISSNQLFSEFDFLGHVVRYPVGEKKINRVIECELIGIFVSSINPNDPKKKFAFPILVVRSIKTDKIYYSILHESNEDDDDDKD